ncbi:hypothetical protein [uncultured Enterovirga sp.]|uniref:hypothetical protein n=1 Tax=uncultured Enterovirga sp. TaxID=2026352 RepID=UPI0035CA0EAB
MRSLATVLLILISSGPAWPQSLDGSLNGSINTALFGSLEGGVASGLSATVGPRQGPLMPGQSFDDNNRDFVARQELERAGFSLDACAPTQLDLNHSGCRPIRELSARAFSNYDLSMQAMRPLGGLILEGQMLDAEAGPAGPLD